MKSTMDASPLFRRAAISILYLLCSIDATYFLERKWLGMKQDRTEMATYHI